MSRPPYHIWRDADETGRVLAVASAAVGLCMCGVGTVNIVWARPRLGGIFFLMDDAMPLFLGAFIIFFTSAVSVIPIQQREEMFTGRLTGVVKWGNGPDGEHIPCLISTMRPGSRVVARANSSTRTTRLLPTSTPTPRGCGDSMAWGGADLLRQRGPATDGTVAWACMRAQTDRASHFCGQFAAQVAVSESWAASLSLKVAASRCVH